MGNRWHSTFIAVMNENAKASHRSIYSLWWGEMGKALHPPTATVSTADRKKRKTWKHSTLSWLNPNHSPFQVTWPRGMKGFGWEPWLTASSVLSCPCWRTLSTSSCGLPMAHPLKMRRTARTTSDVKFITWWIYMVTIWLQIMPCVS